MLFTLFEVITGITQGFRVIRFRFRALKAYSDQFTISKDIDAESPIMFGGPIGIYYMALIV